MSIHDEVVASRRCRKCKARKGESCVYLTPAPSRRRIWVGGQSRWEYPEPAYRVGDPMKGTHIERREDYNRDWFKRKRAAELAAAKASQPAWLWALRQFDARETEAMRTWLRSNWTLFRLRKETGPQ